VALHHQRIGIGGEQRVEREQVAGILEYPPLVRIVESDELKVLSVPLI
jgi:hypothetical protein